MDKESPYYWHPPRLSPMTQRYWDTVAYPKPRACGDWAYTIEQHRNFDTCYFPLPFLGRRVWRAWDKR